MAKLLTLLVLAGAIGTLSRYFTIGFVEETFGVDQWVGTFAVNIIGSFIVGFVWILSEEKSLVSMQTRIVLLAGFTGAFTTFSTLMFDTVKMFEQSRYFMGGLNVFGQCSLGILVFYAGMLVARTI